MCAEGSVSRDEGQCGTRHSLTPPPRTGFQLWWSTCASSRPHVTQATKWRAQGGGGSGTEVMTDWRIHTAPPPPDTLTAKPSASGAGTRVSAGPCL